MNTVETEITAYQKHLPELERQHMGKWVLFQNSTLQGAYDHFEEAAEQAVTKFGRGPYLIRQVGKHSSTLPASVLFRATYA